MTRMIQLATATLLPRRQRPGTGPFGPSTTVMRVKPGDLDFYLHVNNGSYLQMMDVARSNFLADIGALAKFRDRGWYPVVAASTMTYKRSLKLFDRVTITSRVMGWDRRVVYLEQVMTRGEGEFCARGWIAARFLGKDGVRVAPQDVVKVLGDDPDQPSPELPDDVAAWARGVAGAPRAVARA